MGREGFPHLRRRLSAQRVTRGSDGVEIAYATHGAGAGDAPAVVLVHGWAGNRTYWDQARRRWSFPMLEDPEQFNPILATTLASFAGRVRKS